MNLYPITPNSGVRFFVIGLLLAFLFLSSGFISSLAAAALENSFPTAHAAPVSTSTPAQSLRLMSWNAYFLNRTPENFIQEVATLQPDIIALQELGQVMMDEILAELQDEYPYMLLDPSKIPAGSAVLSRYPILDATAPDYDVWSGCNCQVVTLDVAGEVVTLINAHPWPPEVSIGGSSDISNLFSLDTTAQDPIFKQLMKRIDAVTTPLLVVGDLNTMPFQDNVQNLKAKLTDAFDNVGSGAGYTFPSQATDHGLPPHPFMRIDYIFHSHEWQPTAAWNGTIVGSDHRYIVADLSLQ